MTGRHKFSLKKLLPAFALLAMFCAVTWRSDARHISGAEIYSTLTTDTSRPPEKTALFQKPIPQSRPRDTVPPVISSSADSALLDSVSIRNIGDSTQLDTSFRPKVDTFSLRMSSDTLDAPVNYEAEDSAVVMIDEKKILLYGKTKTVYKEITLEAPKVEMDQQTSLVTAYNLRDSAGEIVERARMQQAENKFQSDTIRFNFKSQKGLTTNTTTQQDEMFIHGERIKKIDPKTFFVRHGRFTTCNLDDPHFAFVSNKLKVINNKVAISGPTHPEFEGVPIPIYLPFGYFPLNSGRHSGFLQATFTTSEDFGVGLTGLGYYKVINDNIDATLQGDIYSYGGWNASLMSTYRKRYRYNGGFNLSLAYTKLNFKGDPDYTASKNFLITWNHSVDPRSRPGTSFSANVNAGTSKYNQYLVNRPNQNFQNQLSSSIAYSKTWTGKPYNLTLSANHNQNTNQRLVNVILPDAGFTVNTLYPFQRETSVGTPKWYEKLGIGYNGVARNHLAFYDTAKTTVRRLLDTLQWGAQHRIPISVSLPAIGPLQISPSVSYEETWLTQRSRHSWNAGLQKVDTLTVEKGMFIDRHMSFSLNLATALFGTFHFKNSRLSALRHVLRPNISINYTPNMSKKYYDFIPYEVSGETRLMPVSQFSSNDLFDGYSYGRFGGIAFGLDNNLEGKWKSKKDTSSNGIKKIRLIDGFGFTSGYNFLADSSQPKLLPFQLSFRSSLFEKINLTATATLDPYATNGSGQIDYNHYVWQNGRFRPGRLSGGSISLSSNFQSKERNDGKKSDETDDDENQNRADPTQITDPTLLNDQERLMDYMRRNPSEFVDFNIPWSISLAFSLNFYNQLQSDFSYKKVFSSSFNFNGDFSLTPKWKVTGNGSFDLDTRKLQLLTMSINRDMHCWQMAINVTPVGPYRFFSFTISPKASMLQDLKVNRTRTFYNY